MKFVEALPLDAVIDVVNGWAQAVRREAGDEHDSFPDPPPATRPLLDELTDPDVQLARVAETIYPIFAADPSKQRVALINAQVEQLRPTPALTEDGSAWGLADGADPLAAASLLALMEHAREDPGFERLGTCNAHSCIDAFCDRSRAATRRYCSLTCQNRAKVAAFRRRHA